MEHSTLPRYLTALYSLDPVRNADAAQLIGGVFVEEMIHFALAANLLNAVGGQLRLDAPHCCLRTHGACRTPPRPSAGPAAVRAGELAWASATSPGTRLRPAPPGRR
ncbi:ferritin-like domain-containing protein [Streptomyces sp. MBT84]|uniref:ferritin-like domain-containing protein n=1 Tax=Streptomyces sp. MBT84 TaxID=1488414 RepID=UPI0027DEE207|nr:ferritin-like domain-containing protein [Streptomyces sp. MBT84]